MPFSRFALLLLLSLAVAPPGVGQSLWSTPYAPNQIALEVLQPGLDAAPDESISPLTSAHTFWGSYLVNDRATVVLGVPTAYYRSDRDNGPSLREVQVGNPYVGVGVSSTRVPLLVELGARLPLAPDPSAATLAGQTADLAHREAFDPHLLAAQLVVNTRWDWSRNAGMRLRGGPLLTRPTQEAPGSTELYARYGLQIWYEGDRFIYGTGTTGRALLTERGGAFADRTIHQATGTLLFNLSHVQPGVLFRIPINGPGSERVGFVVGLTLSATW